MKDRIIQRMILNAVDLFLPEGTWSSHSDAIAEVNQIREEGYKFAIKLDLKSFFDNVPHDRLRAKLMKHIADRRVVSLVMKFLTPIMRDMSGNLWYNRLGSPQGSVISPWLTSKLYLDELDQELTARGLRFVRYADDVTVFCHSFKAAKRVKANLIDFVEQVLKCPVNHRKTEIVGIHGLSILGVTLKKGKWYIDPKKEKEYCGIYIKGLELFRRTGDEAAYDLAVSSMKSTIAYYRAIPGIDARKINALEKWAAKKMRTFLQSMPLSPEEPTPSHQR